MMKQNCVYLLLMYTLATEASPYLSNTTQYKADDIEEKPVRYDTYKVYSLIPSNDTQVTALQELQGDPQGLDFWTLAIVEGQAVQIMASDENYPVLEAYVKKYGVNANILFQDVQKLIEAQLPSNGNETFSWDYYYDLDKIYEWLDIMISKYPTILTPLTIGNSYEGRPIRGVKLSYESDDLPGVFIESGIHAREWIAPATALWILKELLTSEDSDIRLVAEKFNWYIFPCVNPDGYQYSHKYDRFWRKTRSVYNGTCKGVDANRNWDFHWSGGGDPCSSIYSGPEPFSEPETRIIAEYAKSLEGKIDVYLDFHSYSQFLMFPYGYTNETVSNYDQLMRIANKSAESLESVYGTRYTVGDIWSVVYPANGSSLDWMYGVLNISFCFAYELRDRGQTGMLLPADQIIPTGIETMVSVVTMLKESNLIDTEKEDVGSAQERARSVG